MARRTTLFYFLLACLASSVAAQTDLFQYIGRIPECGLTCILEQVPLSSCNSLGNTTCICADPDLYAATQECVRTSCESALDAIETAKVEAEACQRPFRDRRDHILAPLSLHALGFFAVCIRLYSRWSLVGKFEADDWIMLVCVVLFTPFIVLGQVAGQIAFGRDVWTVDPDDLTTGLRLFYVAESFYLVILGLTKISLLCFFLRIFPNPKFRWATYGTMLVTGMSTTVLVFMQIFQCKPIRFNWEGWKGHFGSHRCLDINALAFTAAGIAILLDLVILLLPLPLLYHLKMSWKHKAGIAFMFSLGIFILVTACIRLQYLVVFAKSANPTWDYSDALIWSGLEVAVSMLVTSLPAIRLLINKHAPGVFSTIASKTGRSGAAGTGKKTGSGGNSMQSATGDLKSGDAQQQGSGQHQRSASKFSIYRLGAGRRGANESEEALELGDRGKGDVHTEIGVAGGPGGGSSNSRGRDIYGEHDLLHSSVESGIHVQTTTTVDSGRGRV